MKKYLFLLLCTVGFVACSDSDNDNDNNTSENVATLAKLILNGNFGAQNLAFTYDKASKLTTATSNGSTYEFAYTEEGKPEKASVKSEEDGDYEVAFNYTTATEIEVTSEDGDTNMLVTLDDKGQVIAITNSYGDTKELTYDEAGNIVTVDGGYGAIAVAYGEELSVISNKAISPIIWALLTEYNEDFYTQALMSVKRVVKAEFDIEYVIDEQNNSVSIEFNEGVEE